MKDMMEMNADSVSEIIKIKNDPVLNVQVLCLVQVLNKGVHLLVELLTKNESLIIGKVWACTGHSFVIGSEKGVIANIRFSDIDSMEIRNLKIGA